MDCSDIYESYRDVCGTIAIHDRDEALGLVADRARTTMSRRDMGILAEAVAGSRYEGDLLQAYAAIMVMEAA